MKWNGFGNGAIVCIAPLSLIVPDQIMMIMISSEVGTLSARPLLSLCADVAGIVSAVTTVEGPSEFTWWCFTCSVSSGAELEISFGPRGLWLSFRLTRLPTSHKQRKRNNYFLLRKALSSSLLVSLCLYVVLLPVKPHIWLDDLPRAMTSVVTSGNKLLYFSWLSRETKVLINMQKHWQE